MTVIAWDGRTLAADRRATSGFGYAHRATRKIFKLATGELAGFTGEEAFGHEVLAWYRNGADPASFPPTQREKEDWAGLIIIGLDRVVQRYERTPFPCQYRDPWSAWGSGREFASAILFIGRSAIEAVEVACALDPGCGNGIDTFTLGAD